MEPTKPLVYIVDDDKPIRELGLMLFQTLAPDFEVAGFPSGAAAVQGLSQRAPDVIISDQQMPGMSGTDLLEHVRQHSPETIRILLSGFLRTVGNLAAAHQCLGKPQSYERLIEIVRCCLAAQAHLTPAMRKALGSMRSFPVLPAIYHSLIHHLNTQDWTVDTVADLLAQDAGCTTRIIQLANTPFFRGSQPVTDINDAILRLGTENLKPIILSLHVFRSANSSPAVVAKIQTIWSHSFKAAGITGRVARAARMERDQHQAAFFSAMFHDLGKLVLLENDTDAYLRLLVQQPREDKLVELEKTTYSVDHADAAAFLLRLWQLEREVADAVGWHHQSVVEHSRVRQSKVACCLQVADAAAEGGEVHPELLAALGISAPQLREAMDPRAGDR